MAHQPGMGRGVGPGGTPYNFDPMHQADPHLQAHMQSPRPEHFPPTSPIFTGTPTMPGPVTPSCTTPPMGTTSIPRYPLRSPTHPMYPGDQRVSPVSTRNLMDPNLPMHYQYPPFYHGRRQSYSEEQPITSSPGGTHHLPAYPAGVMSQQMPNVPSYPNQNIPKRNQPVKGGTRRNPGLQIEFSPTKAVEMGHEGFLPGSSPYPPSMLRSPAYSSVPQSPVIPGNASDEIKEMRRKVVEYFHQNIEQVKKRYQLCLQELFFLQHGGSLVDFPLWRRRPTPQWVNYQATHKLEDEIDFFVTSNPMDNTPVQSIGNDYIALQHKFYPGNVTPGNIQPGKNLSASGSGFGNPPRPNNPHSATHAPGNPIGGHIDLASSKLFMSKDANFGPSIVRQLNKNSSSSSAQDELAAAKALAFNTSKEDIMLEAKREADILKRVSELRKEGLWSAKRLPKVQEPSRNKSHWDYVLEEMAWLATDFAQERRWKKGVAKKLSKAVLRYHQEIRTKEVKAEKESTVKLQKIASSIAKEVRQFWLNIEKVVQYKVQSRIEEKRKKALDVHLNFIVGQTEKYSSWLAESLKEAKPSTSSSVASSVASSTAASSPVSSRQDDTEEETDLNISDESDDEETIDVEESYETKEFTSAEDEISALQRESEIPIDDLLESLPLEMFAEQKPDDEGSNDDEKHGDDDGDKNDEEKSVEIRQTKDEGEPSTSAENEGEKNAEDVASDGDDEFVLRDTMVDVDDEGTLDEEEKFEEKEDHAAEISQLEEEGELPIEELLKKYNVGDEFDADEVHRDDESEESVEEDSSEEDEGMEFLLQSDAAQETQPAKPNAHSESPNQELTDAAATAESLQPTGYTLETTQVKTPIPFLLRGGTLREYQYIGLDWLVTMYEKCLNGILADEMGLGKTIMTIAVLAHLACERGSWGPHLIVVPTSVMLNWEMEFKKWCPGFKILTYYGSQKERKIKRTGWTKPNAFHVCITSYKLVVQDHQSFRRKKWKYLILDEAQNIKNFKSQRWQYLLNFNTERRLLLTGTPLQNNLMELWSLMHFLMPHLFESHKDFKDWFSNPLSGMIEGSSEYNENLIKRLHKVLRPFLLRRLKSEVEKQMPQKFEHIIRCRLSKRQRVLYDDFMSQTRTKETLESGHLLSVINILMQLRKVCNHPDLFEPRPTVTSLKMTGIVYTTASLVLTALDEHPLNTINFYTMNLILTQLEFSLSAFARHRVRQLQTPRDLITEIDNYTPPETPLLFPVKSDLHSQSHNGHVLNHTKPNGPLNFPKPSWPPGTDVKAGTPTYPETETLCPGYAGQIYTPPSEQDNYNAFNSIENNACTYNTVGSSMFGEIRDSGFLTSLGQVTGDVKAAGNLSYTNRTLLKTSRALNASDVRMYGGMNGHVGVNSTAVLEQKKVLTEKASEGTLNKGVGLGSPFAMARLDEKRFHARQHRLRFLAAVNERRCLAQPVYGQDLVQSVTVLRNPLERSWCKTSCHRPSICETLQNMTKSPQERIDEMQEITKRFVFAIPSVTSQRIEMHTCHPPPSYLTRQKHIEERLQSELSDKLHILHPIIRGQLLQFPEVRLIQYDCGKLQTLDVLLRRLKTEKHRVLIFTQMTKMLNVLERFLNYHGYLYVRLDGTTRVEQRQVLMERFNNDKKIFCFILSTRSGGVGVNLTGADTVIFYDSDWNPTMDAQAQDRCHRIGQTQDVHIYRLISEKTIEENILKKAHQKRLLGEIAIEGGNFTTTVLRESTVRDLFSVNENDGDFEEMVTGDKNKEEQPAKKNPKSQNAFEEVLMKAEDEQDVKAASRLKAEQDAELAEFNESIPLDDDTSNGQISKVEEELRELESQLSGVERYAVHFVESTQNFATDEELEIDEKKLQLSKKEWELGHVQTLKDEEERRAGAEDLDENLEVTYTTEESRQVKKSKNKSSNSKKEKADSKKPQAKSSAGAPSPASVKPQTKSGAGSKVSVTPRPVRSTRRSAAASRGEN